MEESERGRWQLYHTPTGRLTGFLREKQKLRDKNRKADKRPNPIPWKPPYTSPLSGSKSINTLPVLNKTLNKPLTRNYKQSSLRKLDTKSDLGSKMKTSDKDTENTEDEPDGEEKEKEDRGESDDSDSTYSSWSDGSQSNDNETEAHKPNEMIPLDEKKSYVQDLLQEGEEKYLHLTEQNIKTKQELQERELERSYLEVFSEVTQDILRRGVLTKPALDLLCQNHIDRHKHRLREDEMVKRLAELKKRIGIS